MDYKVLMAEKKISVNLSFPPEVRSLYRGLADQQGHGKQKWVVATAAILLLANASEDERRELFRIIGGAEAAKDSYDSIVQKAQKHGLFNPPSERRRMLSTVEGPDPAIELEPASDVPEAKEAGNGKPGRKRKPRTEQNARR